MPSGRILVTGGAGFVGANVAIALAGREAGAKVIAFDNLSRRGSELNLPRLREAGVDFVHGDVRDKADLLALDRIDALVECSAEPSVMAGVDGSPDYVIRTNLMGAYHCLELARRDNAQVIFLSTSRVYPLRHLLGIAIDEAETRFEISDAQELPGVSPRGINEAFPLWGARTMYGATKLSAEHLIEDYIDGYGLRAVVNRFGVIAGPWQMGKVDQGVFTYWMLAHYFKQPLSYIGFGGSGKQVRDLVHIDDVVDLIAAQLAFPDEWSGHIGNAGGGREVSLSLLETTELCAEMTGNRLEIGSAGEDRPGDVPIYISDCSLLFSRTDWRPTHDARAILSDIFGWIEANEHAIRAAL
ncbi:MAG TPA: NAD-dependent epimerase/dehydratase family protein [Thermoleophilaceae bacterium]